MSLTIKHARSGIVDPRNVKKAANGPFLTFRHFISHSAAPFCQFFRNFVEIMEKTEFFRMRRWHCYFLMLLSQAPAVGWIMLALVAGITTAGFLFSPWMGVAAIGFDVFIVMMGMSFVIMVYGFNSVTGLNMVSHSLRIVGESVIVSFEAEENPGEVDMTPSQSQHPAKNIEISKKDLLPYHIYSGGVLIPVEGPRRGFLWLPTRAFPTDAAFSAFLSALYH